MQKTNNSPPRSVNHYRSRKKSPTSVGISSPGSSNHKVAHFNRKQSDSSLIKNASEIRTNGKKRRIYFDKKMAILAKVSTVGYLKYPKLIIDILSTENKSNTALIQSLDNNHNYHKILKKFIAIIFNIENEASNNITLKERLSLIEYIHISNEQIIEFAKEQSDERSFKDDQFNLLYDIISNDSSQRLLIVLFKCKEISISLRYRLLIEYQKTIRLLK